MDCGSSHWSWHHITPPPRFWSLSCAEACAYVACVICCSGWSAACTSSSLCSTKQDARRPAHNSLRHMPSIERRFATSLPSRLACPGA